MKKTILKNGLRILHQASETEIFTINASILASSLYETAKNSGMSHFLEHMVFEGTKNRTCQQLSTEIEKLGGEMNAYTSNEKTNFYIKIHKKHAEKAIEILADIIINPKFNEKSIKKEKKVIIGEIKMIKDDPRHDQWDIFQKKLFKRPFSNSVIGTKASIFKLKRKDLVEFHDKYYVPKNIIITIIGNYPKYIESIKKYFAFKTKKSNIELPKYKIENSHKDFTIHKKNLKLQYIVIGYQTPLRLEKDSFSLDVITAILSKGQSGKLFEEIRTKRGLTYNFGILHNPGFSHSFLAFYANAEKRKIPLIEKIFFTELNKLKNASEKDIEQAKSFLEGQIVLKNEDSQDYADAISLFEECGDCNQIKNYVKNIRAVTKKDIKDAIKKYLNDKYTRISLV
ncbi:MAG: M16 family metallopeptidase [Candidatus Woesearchaeota archaeon]